MILNNFDTAERIPQIEFKMDNQEITKTMGFNVCNCCDAPTDIHDSYNCESCGLFQCTDCATDTRSEDWPTYIFGSDDCSVCKGDSRCFKCECLKCERCLKCDGFHHSDPARSGNAPDHVYNNLCVCDDVFNGGCWWERPEDYISFQLGKQKPTPSNLFQFVIRFIDKYPLYSKRILMGGACEFALKESQKTIKLTALLDSGVDYWKRKFHGFHSKEMKEIVFILLLIYRRSCTKTNTLQLPDIPQEIWLLFPQFLRSADVSIHPSIKF